MIPRMKRTRLSPHWFLWLPVAGLLAAADARGAGDALTVDSVAAQVNDRIITLSEVRAMAMPMEAELRKRYSGPELEKRIRELWQDAVNQLVERALIVWDFDQQEYTIPEKVIDDEIRRIVEQDFDGDSSALRESLRLRGRTYDQFREEMRQRIIVQLMRRKMIDDQIFVSPKKIEEYYRDHADEFRLEPAFHVRTLQIRRPEDKAAEADALIEKVRAELDAGGDFGTVAESIAKESDLARVRDWGWIEPGTLRPELDEAAASTETGKTAGPVDVGDVVFFVHVEERREGGEIPLDDVREDIEKKLTIEEQNRLHREWIDSIRKRAYVRITDLR